MGILLYLRDGHGDVEEFAPASLRNGPGEKQLQAIFGKKRPLILKTQMRQLCLISYNIKSHKKHPQNNMQSVQRVHMSNDISIHVLKIVHQKVKFTLTK